MKNKPYPAILRPSNLSNEIKKRLPKSRETILLTLRTTAPNGVLLPINHAAAPVYCIVDVNRSANSMPFRKGLIR
jgi:hypothetical protein